MEHITKMAAQTVIAFLQGLEGEMDAATAEAADIMLRAAVRVGPSPSHPENIWATGDMRASWRKERVGFGIWRVYNTQDYSGYADEGYTRYNGKSSARPWKARGSTDYTAQIVEAAQSEIDENARRRLENARG
jgi:hypothetical protein